MKGPLTTTIWFFVVIAALAVVAALFPPTTTSHSVSNSNSTLSDGDGFIQVIYIRLGFRSLIALAGYVIMQVGLWHTENKWDEEGSTAWIDEAKSGRRSESASPEELEKEFGTPDASKAPLLQKPTVTIPPDKLLAAFPTPWGFLVGWWVWGISYLFPIDGSANVAPTKFGFAALAVCFFVSFVASIPMADAVMKRLGGKKKMLSVMFLLGWITLGVVSALDTAHQVQDEVGTIRPAIYWCLCMLGPVTIIMSQKELFGARKMGTLWEESGAPNFHPIVYNMGGPLFVWGWFMLWVGTSGVPGVVDKSNIFPDSATPYIPIFLNVRTLVAFVGGCGMVPVVRFLDYSHDEDGKWLGENSDGMVFKKWWLGTDGTYFGVFLESPWPFVIAWTSFGFASFFTLDNSIHAGGRQIALLVNCLLQGVDAGILIQQNLYAGNMGGKQKFSLPFLLLFIILAVNIGQSWSWTGIRLSLPGAILIILGQKTVFGDRKRGDYTMQNQGKANPYQSVKVYSWGEVFFMVGWILICLGMSLPGQPAQ